MNRIFTRISTLIIMMAAVPAFAQNCPFNLDFEMGDFTGWQSYIGDCQTSGGVNVITVSPSPATPGRQTIIPFSGAVDQYGGFPQNCPNGSGFSVKLGNNGTGSQAERIAYNINVPASSNNYSIVYQYAVVLEDPSHPASDQPRFTAKVYDVATNGSVSIGCSSFNFVAGALPGFTQSTVSSGVYYKPWSAVTINLSGYAGHTVRLEFTTADCTQSGHFGYAYIDVNAGCVNPLSNTVYCPNVPSVTVNAPSGYQSYQWWNMGFTTQLGNNPSYTFAQTPSADTSIMMIAKPFTGFGCPDTIIATLHPLPLPVANAGPDVMQCNGTGGSVTVTLGGPADNNLSYFWSPTGGSLSDPNAANPTITTSTSVKYYLMVMDNNTSCTNKDTVSIAIGTKPTVAFTIADDDQCLYQNSFQYASTGTNGTTYDWTYGDGANGTGASATHSYTTVNTFPVKLVVTSADGCKDSLSKSVTTRPSPTGTITTANTNICQGATNTLTAAGGSTYVWYLNGTAINGATTGASLGATQAGSYTATTTDQYGCVGALADTIVMTVTTAPVAGFDFQAFCEGIAAQFTNTSTAVGSGAVTYLWDYADGSATSTVQQEDHTFTTGGTYNVKLTVTPTVCPNLANTITRAVDIEKPKAGKRYTVINTAENTPTALTAAAGGASYLWSPGLHLTSTTTQATSFSGVDDFNYTVTITTPKGCVSVDSQLVRVFKETNIVVPTGFTPNGDGRNDKMFPFTPGIAELKFFRVINRWGTVVYQTSTIAQGSGWDGTYKGQPQPVDSYMWEAVGVDVYGKSIVRKGTFTLLR